MTILALLLAAATTFTSTDTTTIDKLTGLNGAMSKDGVYKVSAPRNDLAVTVRGTKIVPAMGLASWCAFERTGKSVMVMGDLVLTEDQVDPVMSAALDAGLEVTALHNHFAGDSPRVMFMHVGGMGDLNAMAEAAGKVFEAVAKKPGEIVAPAPPPIDVTATKLDTAAIDAKLGTKGEMTGGVYKVVVGRTVKMHGASAGASMGVNTWAAFGGTDSRAVVDGDFAMHEDELQGVLKSLRKAGISVVAIHQHMSGETPRTVFLHYWGVGPSGELAAGLAAALAQTHP
jgi:hypothetical protein